jgi:hypothetical protein
MATRSPTRASPPGEGAGDDGHRSVDAPELVQQAWDYFRNVQTKDQKYIPFISDKDQPALWLNEKIMQKYGPR